MRALILVDIQNDFMPDGALPVPGGYDVVPVANALAERFELVVATQDWHPPDHGSFASNNDGMKPGDVGTLFGLEQVMWPDHCVQGTRGAEFVDELELSLVDEIVQKGTNAKVDSYSGFFDNGHRHATGLADILRKRAVTHVVVSGVATDYCVKFTVLDALEEGFAVTVVTDGCRGVEMNEGDVQNAWAAMTAAGAVLLTSSEVP